VSWYGAQARGSEHTRSVAAVVGEPLVSRFDLKFDYVHGRLWMRPVDGRGPVPFNRSGLNLSKLNDGSCRITGVVDGSPAAESGIKVGEIIDEIAGQASRSLSRADVVAILQQAPGTSIDIALRDGAGQPSRLLSLRLRDVL
jgi:S1-C subfamily serine protease